MNSQHIMIALSTCDNGNTVENEIAQREQTDEFAPALAVLREQGLIS